MKSESFVICAAALGAYGVMTAQRELMMLACAGLVGGAASVLLEGRKARSSCGECACAVCRSQERYARFGADGCTPQPLNVVVDSRAKFVAAPALRSARTVTAVALPTSSSVYRTAPSAPPAYRTRPLYMAASDGQATKKPLTTGYGMSTNPDPAAAVKEAIAAAGVPNPSFAFVACTVAHDPAVVASTFASELPSSAGIHGVTSSGVLLESAGPQAGVGCLLFDESAAAFPTAFAATGAEAATALRQKCLDNSWDVRAIMMATTPGAEEGVIADIGAAFGPNVPVVGGTAADNELSGGWRVLTNTGAFAEGVSLVAVTYQGGVKMGASMIGPYSPTDKTASVTAAEGRKVTEIDGKPAADWVLEWLGDDVKEAYENGGLVLPQTAQKPIGIKQPNGEFVSCHLAALNTDKSVDFFTPVNTGDELTVMASGDGPATGYGATLADAYDVAAKSGGLSQPSAGVLYYCGGMAIAVGDNLSAALASDAFKNKVEGLPLLGMTVFGEQASLGGFDPSGSSNAQNVQRNLSLGMVLFE